MRPLTPLCLLAQKHGTDKGGRHNTYNGQPCHGTHEYTPSYYDFLNPMRSAGLVKSVLEIGVNAGNSLYMWREFFPEAMIYGLDIDPGCLIHDERIRCFQADQGDRHSLMKAVVQIPQYDRTFDVIIDDGSHQREHQAVSLQVLLPLLSDTGVYVIEDVAREDKEWHDYILSYIPEGYCAGLVVPEFKGTGSINDEILIAITRQQDQLWGTP